MFVLRQEIQQKKRFEMIEQGNNFHSLPDELKRYIRKIQQEHKILYIRDWYILAV